MSPWSTSSFHCGLGGLSKEFLQRSGTLQPIEVNQCVEGIDLRDLMTSFFDVFYCWLLIGFDVLKWHEMTVFNYCRMYFRMTSTMLECEIQDDWCTSLYCWFITRYQLYPMIDKLFGSFPSFAIPRHGLLICTPCPRKQHGMGVTRCQGSLFKTTKSLFPESFCPQKAR